MYSLASMWKMQMSKVRKWKSEKVDHRSGTVTSNRERGCPSLALRYYQKIRACPEDKPLLLIQKSRLHLDLNLNTTRKFKFHQRINSLSCWRVDINQTLIIRQLELLTCLLVDEGWTVNGVDTFVCRQGDGTADDSTCCLNGLHDFLCWLVHKFVVIALQLNTNFLTHCWMFLIVKLNRKPLKSHLLSSPILSFGTAKVHTFPVTAKHFICFFKRERFKQQETHRKTMTNQRLP